MDDRELRELVTRMELQIAIDGPAGAGKSTVGSGLATRLECAFLDTGLMYRAVAWLALQAHVAPDDAGGLDAIALGTDFSSPPADFGIFVNGVARGDELRSAAVDAVVSEVSAHPAVRRALVEKQQMFARGRGIVMVGRDIGTTVLPDAQLKLWITASAEERARRRLIESLEGSGGMSLAAMADRIRERDALDASRAASPLRMPADAVVITTDHLNGEEAVEAAIAEVMRVVEESRTAPRPQV